MGMVQGFDATELNEEAMLGLKYVETWLQSPCFASVKIDGTNVGVDNEGRLVGRNLEIERGASYQKVDVWDVLDGFPEKAQTDRLPSWYIPRYPGGEKADGLRGLPP